MLNATRQEPRLSNSLPAEDQQILRHLVEHHNLNPSQALAVRQCLDEGAVVSSMTGGAGTGKSETLVACIKAVMWQQGYFDPCIPNPKAPDSIHTGRKGGGGGGTNRQPPSGMHLGHLPNKRIGRQPDAAGDPIGRTGSRLLKGGPEGPPRALDAVPSCKGPDPPHVWSRTTKQQSKRRWPIIRTAMAHCSVPSTAAGFSLQQLVWSPHGGSCCYRVTHKLGSHSASWMSPRGIASQWVWTWQLVGHSARFVGMPVNCAHTVPSLFLQLQRKRKGIKRGKGAR